MIESLQVINYQSHKNSLLEFDEGLNIIIGISDSGKTALLRALRWLRFNRPGGDAFRSTFTEKDTEVIIITKEGNVVTRAKGKENLYRLNDYDFKAFGTDVPKEIAEVLNLSEICFSRQFDQPFLLTDSAGEVASHWNRIAHLEAIDMSTKKVQSWINTLTQDIKSGEKQIEQMEVELLAYSNLERMEVDIEVLEGLEKDLQTLRGNTSKLLKLIVEVTNVKTEIEEYSTTISMEPDIDAILDLYDAKEAVLKDFNALALLLNSEDKITREIALKTSVIGLEADTDALLKMIAEKEATETEFTALLTLFTKITNLENKIQEHTKIIALETLLHPILDLYAEQEEITQQQEDLTTLLEKLNVVENSIKVLSTVKLPKLQAQFEKEMGSECILCGQPIKNHKH